MARRVQHANGSLRFDLLQNTATGSGLWAENALLGGFNPDPALTPAVAVASLLHQYTTPPESLPPLGTRFLYHATNR